MTSISPKKIFKKCFEIKLINGNEFDCCRNLIVDRNYTSHTYHKMLAEKISKAIPGHYEIMEIIVERTNKTLIEQKEAF